MINYRRSWGREYVEYLDAKGALTAIPLAWTDASEIDLFIEFSKGRSHYRFEDLVRLSDLLNDIAGLK